MNTNNMPFSNLGSLSTSRISRQVKLTLIGSGVAAMIGYGSVANADALGDLKKQLEALQNRVEQMEQDQKALEEKAVVLGDSPGTYKAPGSRTSIKIDGYIKADFIYDSDSDLGDSFVASSIPADGTVGADLDGHTRFHARQSRLRIQSFTDLGNDDSLNTRFEGDFFGGGGNQSFSNSTSFRIRHAVIDWNRGGGTLTAGQTWSNFMDFVAYPSTVDFFGPAGKSFVRATKLQWATANGLSFSLENPETDGVGAAGRLGESRGGIGEDTVPDITVAWRGGPGGAAGNYEFAAVFRELGVNGIAPAGTLLAGTRLNDSESGWGVNLAGVWQLGSSASFSASTTFGDGIGRYIINGFGNDIFVNPDGSIETVESASVNAALLVNWSDTTSSTLAFGHFENDNPFRSNGIDTLDTVHLNYMWKPAPGLNLGVEGIFGDLENADGSSGDATRLQFAVQRSF